MRLTCPNCDAVYEVEPDLIPAEGRDVQCSNCDHTWFEPGSAEAEDSSDDSSGEMFDDLSEPSASEDAADTPQQMERPSLDPDALDIIHEEVERETQTRAAEQAALETQTDLGLSPQDDRDPDATMSNLSSMVSETLTSAEDDTAAEDVLAAAAPSRSDDDEKRSVFPDIDEINSTLDASGDDAPEFEEDEGLTSGRSGFRFGFATIILLAAILFALYAFAPQIAEAVPALSGAMTSYIEVVNSLRLWVDGMVQGLSDQITNLTAGE
ncbi:MAG: zinc-ribbon domain-containing protein [Pseudomonadota bacterium]